jgi:hypothetical protein
MKIARYILPAALLLLTYSNGALAQPVPAATAAQVDLSGDWTFEVTSPRGVTHGAMSVFRVAAGHMGTLTTDQGDHVLPIYALTLAGKTMIMTVASPQGNVIFVGELGTDGNAFTGHVTYHNGAKFPMSGRKAQAKP